MYALISSTENIVDPNTNEVLGWRVAEVADQQFDVYKTLFWVECGDINANKWYYDNVDKTLKEIPQYIPPETNETTE